MTQIKVGQIDLTTGEILEDATLAVFYPKRKNGFINGWVAMAQDQFSKLADTDLGLEAWRVFAKLIGKLDYENYLAINAADIGRQLKMARPSVSRAIAKLIAEGVLLPGPRIQNRGTYTLNPRYGWKGSAKNHNEALKARMKAAGISGVVTDTTPEENKDTRTKDMFDTSSPA